MKKAARIARAACVVCVDSANDYALTSHQAVQADQSLATAFRLSS